MSLPRIAVLGSINVDLVVRSHRLPAPGETIIGDEVFEAHGGKGANQAVGAARLGADVSMIGCVGDDAFADRLVSNLVAEGIEVGAVARVSECSSGLAVVAVESSGENSITVIPGANGRLSPDSVLAAADVIRSASVLLVQLEVPVAAVLAGVDVARQAGVRVVLDPAPAPEHCDPRLLQADLVCPNQTEAAAILGLPVNDLGDARAAAEKLVGQGVTDAIITMGSEGAVWSNGRTTEVAPTPEIVAVDTTAAGDAFAGALGFRLANGDEPFDAVRFACAAGAAAAAESGAQQAMPGPDRVEALLAKAALST